MPVMEYNSEQAAWIKQCFTCKQIFKAETKNWNDATEIMKQHFTFRESIDTADNMGSYCKSCNSNRKTKRKLNGISREEMLATQNWQCAICKTQISFNGGGAVTDHCHETGETRGLLCITCNVRLGVLENKEWIAKANAYKEKFK